MSDERYTHTAGSTATTVSVRGVDLVNDLIGEIGFTQMLYFLTCGNRPSEAQAKLLDACLVTLMEHGLNPSTLITRLAAHSVPGEPQVAMAAGLLAIGSVYAGTAEDCASVLREIETNAATHGVERAAADIVKRYREARESVPGFGHGTHKPDDPRTPKLLKIARESGIVLRYVPLLEELGRQVDASSGRHITINATGAIGALLLEIDMPMAAIRGMAVVARAGGLVGHLLEEQETDSAKAIWRAAREMLPYRDPE